MTVTSLVAVVAPRTGKIIKNNLSVSERRENCILHCVNMQLCNAISDDLLNLTQK